MSEIKHNCNTCKYGMFDRCDTLKDNDEYQEWNKELFSKPAYEFKENFICDDYRCMYIEYPIEVAKINHDTKKSHSIGDRKIGKFVKIRPCGKESKTYLGLYLGDLPIDIHVGYRENGKELNLSYMLNPAIFVFDLNKIVYGAESWWGVIETEDDLKDITDVDIDNIWYIKALKSAESKEGEKK